jgi:hypothetical protein
MSELLEPKTVVINNKKFILSKFPAIQGRKIISSYPLTAIPKVSEYKQNEEIMLELMNFVAVDSGGNIQRLSTPDFVNAQTGDWETLVKVELSMIEYNCSFFRDGLVLNIWKDLAQKLPAWISKTLTISLEQFWPRVKHLFKN